MWFSKGALRILSAACLLLAVAGQASADIRNRRFYCVNVDSRQGWQKLTFPNKVIKGWVVTGPGWTVNARTFFKVGKYGHDNQVERGYRTYHRKYDNRYRFGALLIRPRDSQDIVDAEQFDKIVKLSNAGGRPFNRGWLEFRINDSDAELDDNAGTLTVCLTSEI